MWAGPQYKYISYYQQSYQYLHVYMHGSMHHNPLQIRIMISQLLLWPIFICTQNTHTPSSELLAAVFTVGVSLDIEQYVCTAGSYPLGVCFSNCTVVEVVPRF